MNNKPYIILTGDKFTKTELMSRLEAMGHSVSKNLDKNACIKEYNNVIKFDFNRQKIIKLLRKDKEPTDIVKKPTQSYGELWVDPNSKNNNGKDDWVHINQYHYDNDNGNSKGIANEESKHSGINDVYESNIFYHQRPGNDSNNNNSEEHKTSYHSKRAFPIDLYNNSINNNNNNCIDERDNYNMNNPQQKYTFQSRSSMRDTFNGDNTNTYVDNRNTITHQIRQNYNDNDIGNHYNDGNCNKVNIINPFNFSSTISNQSRGSDHFAQEIRIRQTGMFNLKNSFDKNNQRNNNDNDYDYGKDPQQSKRNNVSTITNSSIYHSNNALDQNQSFQFYNSPNEKNSRNRPQSNQNKESHTNLNPNGEDFSDQHQSSKAKEKQKQNKFTINRQNIVQILSGILLSSFIILLIVNIADPSLISSILPNASTIFLMLSVIILVIFLKPFFQYQHRRNIINEIYQSIRKRLYQQNFEEDTLISEDELFAQYYSIYNISLEDFNQNYLPHLHKLRKNDPQIRLSENNGKVYWEWYDDK